MNKPHSVAVDIIEAVTLPAFPEMLDLARAYLDLEEQYERMEWFLRHRTAEDGMTQWEVYEQCDWSNHPEFASNPAMEPEEADDATR